MAPKIQGKWPSYTVIRRGLSGVTPFVICMQDLSLRPLLRYSQDNIASLVLHECSTAILNMKTRRAVHNNFNLNFYLMG